MVELEDTMETEMDPTGITVKVTPKEEVTTKELEEIIDVLRAGYGEEWISDDHFRDVPMKYATHYLRLFAGDDLAATLSIHDNRITQVAVHPNFQGQGLGIKLFQEAAKFRQDMWITVDIKAEGMIATITDSRLNYFPVEDQDQIEDLFKNLSGDAVGDSYKVEVERIEHPFLSQRLAKKGIKQEKFSAYYRPGALHGSEYKQILWQNQP